MILLFIRLIVCTAHIVFDLDERQVPAVRRESVEKRERKLRDNIEKKKEFAFCIALAKSARESCKNLKCRD